jgi:glycosyltransferase involved in cell wall biosynthesis
MPRGPFSTAMEPLYIIVPFYNAEDTIERTLLSLDRIGRENRSRVRVVGVDDGSGDRSAEIFEKTVSRLEAIEHRLERQKNAGTSSARNRGLKTFDRGWTLLLDADDELLIDPFPYIDATPGHSAVLFSCEMSRNGKLLRRIGAPVIERRDLPLVFSALNPLVTVSIIFRRELLSYFFDEDLLYLEDWHFWAVNSDLFSSTKTYADAVLGRVHIGRRNKTSDQFNNGRFRIMAAGKIADFWGEKAGVKALNNLRLQSDIGRMQMGKGRDWRAFVRFPVSFSLYLKLLVYAFLFPLYRRFGWYTSESTS